MSIFHSFLLLIIFPCRYITHFVYLFTSLWTFGLCSLLGYNEYFAMNICVQMLVWIYLSFMLVSCTVLELLGHMGNLCLTFKKLSNFFPKHLHILHSHQHYVRFAVFPHPEHFLLSVFLIIAIIVDML